MNLPLWFTLPAALVAVALVAAMYALGIKGYRRAH